MNTTLKKILTPFASLKITVTLLFAAMLLIFAGTLAQRDAGIWEVKATYFNSWLVKVPFQNMLPFVQRQVHGWFPFIGGKFLIFALLINLLAAHTVRFKFNWKRSGVLLTHFGLIMLLVGELVTNHFATESQMPILQGESTNWSQDIREVELAVTDTAPADHDAVVSVPGKWLGQRRSVTDARLPFDVNVVKFYPNATLVGPMEQQTGDTLADSGEWRTVKVRELPVVAGTQSENTDLPTAFVQLSKNGHGLGTYLVSTMMNEPQKVTVGDKTYEVALRFKRLYKPYTITLLKFSHDKYVGSEMARNFSSRIRLVDPTRGIDREHVIRMNEPLRYGGETFYQSSFMPGDAGTVLQVVRNPGWLVPYIAVVVGCVGMLIHFGMNLIAFVARQFRPKADPVPFARPAGTAGKNAAAASGKNGRKGGKKSAPVAAAPSRGGYSLAPSSGWGSWSVLLPAGVAAFCLIYVLGHALPRSLNGKTGLDLDTFAEIPVSFDGRPMPLDSAARGTLKIISGRESLTTDDGERVPAIQWLADVLANDSRAHEYKVFRLDNLQLKALLDFDPRRKLFSFDELMTPTNSQRIDQQLQQLSGDPKTWDPYQHKVAELQEHLMLYIRFARAAAIANVWDAIRDPSMAQETVNVAQAADSARPEELTEEQRRAVQRVDLWEQGMSRVQWLSDSKQPQNRKQDLYFAAPTQPGQEWQGLAVTVPTFRDGKPVNPTVQTWCNLLKALHDGRNADFNAQLAEYSRTLDANPPAGAAKVDFETFFNRFDPFTIALALYVGVCVFALLSWLGFRKPLVRTALAVAGVALVVHTFGLVSRMYISGRPPVTNLYSSAVFIGFGAVIFCLVLEALFRNSIGVFVAGVVGFATLLLAGGLYADQADTMGQLQAVLDTNFWLATHVVTITLGYAATYVAGLLGIIFVLGGVLTTAFDADARKTVTKMLYGIVCFATLLSFVGTILGGIWADQSWGRFWGWDPKENGAILIVLWNAILLHARWAGLVRERGLAMLAIGGNIVTTWSYFGTNMLGVGLHSYGFIEGAVPRLVIFCIIQLAIIAIGSLPLSSWRSYSS